MPELEEVSISRSSNYLSYTFKCPNFEIFFRHSTFIVGCGGREENTKSSYAHVEVEHMFNGMERPSATRTWEFDHF
jgi:hypothetical protein